MCICNLRPEARQYPPSAFQYACHLLFVASSLMGRIIILPWLLMLLFRNWSIASVSVLLMQKRRGVTTPISPVVPTTQSACRGLITCGIWTGNLTIHESFNVLTFGIYCGVCSQFNLLLPLIPHTDKCGAPSNSISMIISKLHVLCHSASLPYNFIPNSRLCSHLTS